MFDEIKNREALLWHVDFRDPDNLPNLYALYLIKGLEIVVAIAVFISTIALINNCIHVLKQGKTLGEIENNIHLIEPKYQKAVLLSGELQKSAKWFEEWGKNCNERLDPVPFLATVATKKPKAIEFAEVSFEKQLPKKAASISVNKTQSPQIPANKQIKAEKKNFPKPNEQEKAAYFIQIRGIVQEKTEASAIHVVEELKKTIQVMSVYENASQGDVRIIELNRQAFPVTSLDPNSSNDVANKKTELFDFKLVCRLKN